MVAIMGSRIMLNLRGSMLGAIATDEDEQSTNIAFIPLQGIAVADRVGHLGHGARELHSWRD